MLKHCLLKHRQVREKVSLQYLKFWTTLYEYDTTYKCQEAQVQFAASQNVDSAAGLVNWTTRRK